MASTFGRSCYMPDLPATVARRRVRAQDHGLDVALDNDLIASSRPALEHKVPVEIHAFIRNADRTVGTMLGSEVTRSYGAAGLPDDTIKITFTGSAGQSFGAFIPRGITMTLVETPTMGSARDCRAASVIAYPPKRSTFRSEDNIIVGNVAFYGATSGEACVRGGGGRALLRPQQRRARGRSKASATMRCEYMTGGRVVVLGRTGRNFAAGMSGGIALRARPRGEVRQPLQPRDGRSRAAHRRRRYRLRPRRDRRSTRRSPDPAMRSRCSPTGDRCRRNS